MESSYSWSVFDYYALGHCISHYPFQWQLNFCGSSMGDEDLEMLCKGMASSPEMKYRGKITMVDFGDNSISAEGIKWFVNISVQLAQHINTLDFIWNQLDGNALNVFCEVVPKLTHLHTLSLGSNPIGVNGAVELLKCLYHCKTPLKTLDISKTGVGEEDCAELALLIANTDLEELDIGLNQLTFNSVSSILGGLLHNTTLKQLCLSRSALSAVEHCRSLAELLQHTPCLLRELNIRECGINGDGARYIGAALSSNHSLTEVNISANPIGDIGAVAFGDSLRNNTTLARLLVSCLKAVLLWQQDSPTILHYSN